MKLALVLAFALVLGAVVAAPPAAACPDPDNPCDPDPSQFECFQLPKGTLACVLRIVKDQLP